jgi:acyl-coenzyme A thioesterase PaaI-like protein
MSESSVPEMLRDFVDSAENPCFVCGQHNPRGLHAHFDVHPDRVVARWTPASEHVGWQGVVHGGVLAALLDEAMAYILFGRGIMGMTGRMEIRYRSPARAGDLLLVEARTVTENRRIADLEATISVGERLVADANARFVKVGLVDPATLRRPNL